MRWFLLFLKESHGAREGSTQLCRDGTETEREWDIDRKGLEPRSLQEAIVALLCLCQLWVSTGPLSLLLGFATWLPTSHRIATLPPRRLGRSDTRAVSTGQGSSERGALRGGIAVSCSPPTPHFRDGRTQGSCTHPASTGPGHAHP